MEDLKTLASATHESTEDTIPPFWSLKKPSQKDKLEWLNLARRAMWDTQRARANKDITVNAMYHGEMWADLPNTRYVDNRLPHQRKYNEKKKITVNDVYYYVDELVGKLKRFKPGVLVRPFSNEFKDRDGAQVGKRLYETYEISGKFVKSDKKVKIRTIKYGEGYNLITWDSSKGQISRRWKEANEKYGDKAHKIKKTGWVYDPDSPERAGDISYVSPLNWELLLGPGKTPEDVPWVMHFDYKHKEEIKSLHSNAAGYIDSVEPVQSAKQYDDEDNTTSELRDHLLYVRFWHRAHPLLPKGKEIVFIRGKILEERDNPYSGIEALEDSEWGDLPLERMEFIESDESIHSETSIHFVLNLLHAKNMLLSMANKNIVLAGHPKFLVHRRSKVLWDRLRDNSTIVQYEGGVPPQIVNFANLPNGVFELYALLTQEADKLMKTHQISSGSPPPGITAGVALRLLEEIEDLALSTLIESQNDYTLAVARRTVALAGKFFSKDDGRMIRIVGKDNQDLLEDFDPEMLTQKYNFRVDTINQEARSPAAKQQQIIDLLEVTKDNPPTQEQLIDALELVQPDKITDPAKAAVTAAEAVYQVILSNKAPNPPRQGLNYIVYWRVLMAKAQNRGFEKLPEKAQNEFRKYMLGLEFLMDEHALRNPIFEELLYTQLPYFPAYYNTSPRPPVPVPAPQAASASLQGTQSLAPPDSVLAPQNQSTVADAAGVS